MDSRFFLWGLNDETDSTWQPGDCICKGGVLDYHGIGQGIRPPRIAFARHRFDGRTSRSHRPVSP